MSDLIQKAKAAVGSSSSPTDAGLFSTDAARKRDACIHSNKCQQNPWEVPSTVPCSMPGRGSNVADNTACHTSPGPHPSHVMDKLIPPIGPDAGRSNALDNTSSYPTTDNTIGSTSDGPRSCNVMNKVDPQIDSDGSKYSSAMTAKMSYDGSGSPTYISQPSRMAPGRLTSTNPCPHSSNPTNKVDRNEAHCSNTTGGVAADKACGTTARSAATSAQHASTTADTCNTPHTAKLHNSTLLNKLDPRVDSDMGGCKTHGANATQK